MFAFALNIIFIFLCLIDIRSIFASCFYSMIYIPNTLVTSNILFQSYLAIPNLPFINYDYRNNAAKYTRNICVIENVPYKCDFDNFRKDTQFSCYKE